MFQFQNTPPKDPRGHSLPLVRCPSNRPITGVITSSDLVGTSTHYYRGRTIPCAQTECPACIDGIPWRWHGYIGLFSLNNHRQCLFEFTARAAEPLVAYREAYGSLRGCALTARRASISANSRVIMETKPADLEKITLPAEPDLLAALSIIWNIELPAITRDGIEKNAPKLAVDPDPELKKQAIHNRIKESIAGNQNGRRKTG